MSDTTTEGIRITVKPSFWAERSAPENGQFAFMYTVEIANEGTAAGAAAQPALGHHRRQRARWRRCGARAWWASSPGSRPGERFEYTSWAMLRTPFGTMRGSYIMERPDGVHVRGAIGEFALTQPHALH